MTGKCMNLGRYLYLSLIIELIIYSWVCIPFLGSYMLYTRYKRTNDAEPNSETTSMAITHC